MKSAVAGSWAPSSDQSSSDSESAREVWEAPRPELELLTYRRSVRHTTPSNHRLCVVNNEEPVEDRLAHDYVAIICGFCGSNAAINLSPPIRRWHQTKPYTGDACGWPTRRHRPLLTVTPLPESVHVHCTLYGRPDHPPALTHS